VHALLKIGEWTAVTNDLVFGKLLVSAVALTVVSSAVAAAPAVSISTSNPVTPKHFVFEDFSGYGAVAEQATGPALVNPTGLGGAFVANVNANVFNPVFLAGGRARRPGFADSATPVFPGLSDGNFAAIGQGGRYTIRFADYAGVSGIGNRLSSVSFSFGSRSSVADNREKVTLIRSDGTFDVFTVNDIFGTLPTETSARVRFDSNSPQIRWVGMILESSGIAFEADNFAGAVPEPATWATLILGFGFAGVGLRRTRNLATA
jgi:hypothetical protein